MSSLIIEVEDEIAGLNNINIIDILDYFQQQFVKLNNNITEENNVRLRDPFDVTLGMAAYI